MNKPFASRKDFLAEILSLNCARYDFSEYSLPSKNTLDSIFHSVSLHPYWGNRLSAAHIFPRFHSNHRIITGCFIL